MSENPFRERKYHHDEWVGSSANRVRTIINKNSPYMELSIITGGSAHGKEQVRLATALEQWTRSMGRDTDGQPVSSSTSSQGSRQGSIAAALPGSSIKVGRQASRVRSTPSSYKPAPQRSDSHEADDGFEM